MATPVLIVVNEALVRMELEALVELAGCEVAGAAGTVRGALLAAERCPPALALVAVDLECDGEGLLVAQALQQLHGTRIIFISALRDDHTRQRVERLSPVGIVERPFAANKVIQHLHQVE